MMKTFMRFFLVIAIIALGCVCCSRQKADEGGTKKNSAETRILHLGNGAEPKDLDPQTATGIPETKILDALFEGLFSPHPQGGAPEPAVAQSWTLSSDKLVYTFKLRSTSIWSNGDRVTAHDFVYSYNRILLPKLASEYAYFLYPIKNAEKFNKDSIKDFSEVGVRALNDSMLQITLESPVSYFFELLTHHSTFPVHKQTIEKFGKMDEPNTQWTRPGNIVTNGPFTLKSWELNKYIIVEKNQQYWEAQKVALDQVYFYPIELSSTEELKFRSKELHLCYNVPLDKIAVYREKEPDLLRIDPYIGTYYYRLNVTKKPFTDKKVRQALSLAINREVICRRITKGGQIPAFHLVPKNVAGYVSKDSLEFNIEKAQKLLAEAGYPQGKGFPHVEILYNTNEAHRVIAEAIQQMWKESLQISVTLNNQDWKVYLSSLTALNFQIARGGWIGDYADPNTFLNLFVSDCGNNNTGWSNQEYDQFISQAAKAIDPAARFEVFQKAEKFLLEEMPVIPIYFYTRPYLLSKDVVGWDSNVMDRHPLKYVSLKPQNSR